MSKDIQVDVVILGGGPSGMFASTMCGMVGLESMVIECADQLGGQCSKVYPDKYIFDIPGHSRILAKDLVGELEKQMQRFEPKIWLNTEVMEVKRADDGFVLICKQDNTVSEVITKVLFVSNGNGTIKPIKPLLDNVETLESSNRVIYSMTNLDMFRDKIVVVGGGGDSALDWCLALHEAGASQIYLVHRRNKLRAMESLQEEVSRLTNCSLFLAREIDSVNIIDNSLTFQLRMSEQIETIQADYFVPCYGVSGDKGFLEKIDFPLEQNGINRIIVDPATSESSCKRLYAIGDASTYDHKRKLIAVGFAEAVNAAHHAREIYFNERPFILEYSTTKFK